MVKDYPISQSDLCVKMGMEGVLLNDVEGIISFDSHLVDDSFPYPKIVLEGVGPDYYVFKRNDLE